MLQECGTTAVNFAKNKSMINHSLIEILNESEERVKALVPVIVSASRATDVPAFFCPMVLRQA